MKKAAKLLSIASLGLLLSCGVTMNDIYEAAEQVSQSSGLTQEKASKGLKQALEVGIENASQDASQIGGFLNNQLIKINFPPEIKEVENKLRSIGLGSEVDKFVTSLNRAAEDASRTAAPIFVDAIKEMNINDAINILKGADDAATRYLEDKTLAKLKAAFMPVIQGSLDRMKVNQYWNPLATAYNSIPFTNNVNPDLNDYVLDKATAGLFVLLEKEEVKIRNNASARVTDLLKEVFAYQD